MDDLIFQTTLYVTQQERRVNTVTRQDILGFIGINIIMGYHNLPSYTHYWCEDPDVSVPFISNVMTRNRFSQILSNIHVNDNKKLDTNDKLSKIRPLIAKANSQFAKLYDVRRVQSVDESMVLFKGRSSIKQYCPMKPIKRGYKLWVRADMDGYISKFDVYQGKNGKEDQKWGGFGLGESVVCEMVEDLFDGGHEVYFDNFFNSVPLMDFLKEKRVSACGTIRSNRKGLPSLMKEKDLNKGEFDFRTADDLAFFGWKDNRLVYVLSNFHGTEKCTVLRTQKDGSRVEVSCPMAIKDYNSNMGGVDKADMLCSLYGMDRKSRKWWHRLFFGIIDRMLVNAYVVHNKLEDKSIPLLLFRRSVAQHLLTAATPPQIGRPLATSRCNTPPNPPKRRKTDFSVSADIRLTARGVHWPIFLEKRGRCEVCSQNKIESRPHSQCSTCKVYLCCNANKQCFLTFHEVNNA